MYKKPNRFPGQGPLHKTVSEVRQRVASARMNRLRSLQNQLSDAHGHIGVSVRIWKTFSFIKSRKFLKGTSQ